MIGWAGLTCFAVFIPKSRGSASAPSSRILSLKVRWADTQRFSSIPNMVGQAFLTLLGGGVEMFGWGAHAFSTLSGISNSSRGAADMVGSSGCSSCRADALKEPAIIDSAISAAMELLMSESQSMTDGDKCQDEG